MTNKNKDNSGKQTNNKSKDNLKENFDWGRASKTSFIWDVIIVEDIIDTGLSIKFLYERIMGAHPNSVSVATFLQKPGKAKLAFPIDFIGFEIPHKFVVGYGLDFNQKMRHLDELYYIPDGSDI